MKLFDKEHQKKPVSNRTGKVYQKYMYGVIVISLLFIVPLCIISHYNHPSTDDYGYAMLTRDVWNETKAIFPLLKAAIETSKSFYHSWQGLYSAAFFLALQPGIFGEEYYVLTGYLMLFIIIGSTTYFIMYMSKKIGGTVIEALAISAGMLFLMLQFMPSAVQGLYWFNGAVNYGLFHGLLLLLICCMIEIQGEITFKKRVILTMVGAFFAFLVVGGNHTTALMGAVFPVLVTGYDVIFKKHKNLVYNLIITVVAVIGLLANIMAPGTAVRQSSFGGPMNPVKAVYLSVIYGIYRVFECFDLKVIIVVLILLPVIVSMVQHLIQKGFKFPCPIIVFMASVAWISCMLVPPFYGMHTTGPNRLANIVYFHFIILAFINIFYIIGWIICKLELGGKVININLSWCLTMCILFFGLYVNSKDDMWSVKAMEELRQGIPQQFSIEAYERHEILLQSKGLDVVVDEFSVKPELLYYEGIEDDPNHWCNGMAAKYYGLKSVVTE